MGEFGRQANDDFGLGYCEYLLARTWRKIVVGWGSCPLIAREFSQLCGEDAAEVLAALCVFLQAIAYASRRRLVVDHTGRAGLTGDERQLLTSIAAAQADDQTRFEANLRWLARPGFGHAVEIAAHALGAALAVHGLRLPLPAPVMVQAAVAR